MRVMAELRDRHARNCESPFYVEKDQCISCGAPESEAEGLIAHDAEGHCFFVRQPVTENETNAAIRGVWATCCGAVRYGGNNPQILVRFAELGMSHLCDGQPSNDDGQVVRSCASFVYPVSKGIFPKRRSLRQIIDYLADSLGKRPGLEHFAFRCWWNQASFRVRWGKIGNECGYAVQIRVVYESDEHWLLRISGHEISHIAWAIQIDKALQKNPEFRSIRWFSENEWLAAGNRGKQHPY
jgi:hypothetical protein